MSIPTRWRSGSSGTTRPGRPGASSPTPSCCRPSTTTGSPQSRYLLARGADDRGFAFFTNYESAKSAQLAAEPRAAMLFTWLQLHRQMRVVGDRRATARAESDAYFALAPALVADRGVVVAAVAGASRSCIVGGACRAVRADVRERRGDPASGVLGRVAASAGDARVLAGPPQPPARSGSLPPGPCCRRRLGHRAVGSVAHSEAASTSPSIRDAMGGTIVV